MIRWHRVPSSGRLIPSVVADLAVETAPHFTIFPAFSPRGPIDKVCQLLLFLFSFTIQVCWLLFSFAALHIFVHIISTRLNALHGSTTIVVCYPGKNNVGRTERDSFYRSLYVVQREIHSKVSIVFVRNLAIAADSPTIVCKSNKAGRISRKPSNTTFYTQKDNPDSFRYGKFN